jgi:hypothetical protein
MAVLSTCAAISLMAGIAHAGPCSTEIETFSKTLASKDAGQGPTPGAQASATGSIPKGEHPPTAVMSQETQGVATSSRDVALQNSGQPTAAQHGKQAEHPPTAAMDRLTKNQAAPPGGNPPTAALSQEVQGQNPAPGASPKTADASAALARAKDADRQGKEADCMKALDEAKRLMKQ